MLYYYQSLSLENKRIQKFQEWIIEFKNEWYLLGNELIENYEM